MDSETRSAHRRVGAVAIAAFLALLLLGVNRGPASASQAAPAATSTPSQAAPDFDHGPRDRFRGGDRGGEPDFGGGDPSGEPDFGGGDPGGGPGLGDGGGAAPAPSTPSAPDSGLTTT